MKKSTLFILLAISLFIISLLLFSVLKEEMTSNCLNSTCGKYLKYTDAFTVNPFRGCELMCITQAEGVKSPISYISHNIMYVPFVYLAILFLLVSIALILIKR